VREQNDPVVANELVKVNRTLGGVGLEVWCDGSQAETREELVNKRTLVFTVDAPRDRIMAV